MSVPLDQRSRSSRPQHLGRALGVVVEAGARGAALAAQIDERVDDVLAGRPGDLATLGGGCLGGLAADVLGQGERHLVEHGERRGGEAGRRRCPLDDLRVDALGDELGALVDERAEDAAGVEAASVADDDRDLADLLDEVDRAGGGLVGGVLAADDLDELHLVDRAEEVQPDEVRGARGEALEPGDGQGRGVGAEEGVGPDDGLDLGEDVLLEVVVLEDRLDDGVDVGEVGGVGGRRDPGEGGVAVLLRQAALGDLGVEELGGVAPCPSRRPRCVTSLRTTSMPEVAQAWAMPAPIIPAPRIPTLATLRALEAGRAQGTRVDRLEVEEEGLDHRGGLATGGELGEVARLDAARGVEVDLGALDGRRHDRARATSPGCP